MYYCDDCCMHYSFETVIEWEIETQWQVARGICGMCGGIRIEM